jgi:hypothetical protein
MESASATEDRLARVLEQLIAREPIFHRPEFGTSRADFERMTETTFWEVGASGKRYSREEVLDELERRYSKPAEEESFQSKDFRCQELSENLYLLTYVLLQGSRESRRATIWRSTAEGWKIVYHQGTLLSRL